MPAFSSTSLKLFFASSAASITLFSQFEPVLGNVGRNSTLSNDKDDDFKKVRVVNSINGRKGLRERDGPNVLGNDDGGERSIDGRLKNQNPQNKRKVSSSRRQCDPDVGVLGCGDGEVCRKVPKPEPGHLGGLCGPGGATPGIQDIKLRKIQAQKQRVDANGRLTNEGAKQLQVKKKASPRGRPCDPDVGVLGCGDGQVCKQVREQKPGHLAGLCVPGDGTPGYQERELSENQTRRKLVDVNGVDCLTSTTQALLRIRIEADDYSTAENGWYVRDLNTNVDIAEYQAMFDYEPVDAYLCVTPSQNPLRLRILDSAGDGININPTGITGDTTLGLQLTFDDVYFAETSVTEYGTGFFGTGDDYDVCVKCPQFDCCYTTFCFDPYSQIGNYVCPTTAPTPAPTSGCDFDQAAVTITLEADIDSPDENYFYVDDLATEQRFLYDMTTSNPVYYTICVDPSQNVNRLTIRDNYGDGIDGSGITGDSTVGLRLAFAYDYYDEVYINEYATGFFNDVFGVGDYDAYITCFVCPQAECCYATSCYAPYDNLNLPNGVDCSSTPTPTATPTTARPTANPTPRPTTAPGALRPTPMPTNGKQSKKGGDGDTGRYSRKADKGGRTGSLNSNANAAAGTGTTAAEAITAWGRGNGVGVDSVESAGATTPEESAGATTPDEKVTTWGGRGSNAEAGTAEVASVGTAEVASVQETVTTWGKKDDEIVV